jgi:hypothetical protein
MVILVIFLAAVAVRGLWEQTKRDLAKWRGRPARTSGPGWWRRLTARDTGYWAAQAAHLFPSARHGLHDGWMRGVEAHHEARRAIAQARAEHAEGRAELHPELEDLAARRRKALEEIERQREAARLQRQAEEENRMRDEHPEWFEPEREPAGSEPDPPYSWGREDRTYCTDADSEAEACRFACGASARNHGRFSAWAHTSSGTVLVGTWENGEPVTQEDGEEARRQEQREEEAAQLDEQEYQENEEARRRAGQQEPASEEDEHPVPAGTGAAAEGEQMTETTYAGIKAKMAKVVTETEQRVSEADQSAGLTEEHLEVAREAKAWASVTADEMQALGVDADSLGAMSEHLDAMDAVAKMAAELNEVMGQMKAAWTKAQETAQQVVTALNAAGHGRIQEARDDAAGGGAEKQFYGEGAR